MTRISVLEWHTRRYTWYRPTFSRSGLRTADGRFCQYPQGVKWAFRFGPIVVTRFAACTC